MRDRVESLCAAQLVLAVRGVARLDTLRGGIPAEVGHCWSVLGRAGLGLAKLHTLHPSGCSSVAIRGLVQRIRAGRCSARQTHCHSRRAEVWRIGAWLGQARRGEARQTHCPLSGDRSLRQGLAWPGAAWRGAARQTHSIPAGVLKFAGNTNNERKTQWKTQ
jgi:hypothetical protein